MRPRAIFVAPSAGQAAYWANQWGYAWGEVYYVNANSPSDLFGIHEPDLPAFIVGDCHPSPEMMRELHTRGLVACDGQDLR